MHAPLLRALIWTASVRVNELNDFYNVVYASQQPKCFWVQFCALDLSAMKHVLLRQGSDNEYALFTCEESQMFA